MKTFIYCYKNKLQGLFAPKPFFTNIALEDMVEMVKHDLGHADNVTLESLKEDELYYLGYFDTETGIVYSHLEFVQDIGAVASELLVLKEKKVDDHGKDCEN